MSIRINKDKCVRCKKCTGICPGNLIEFIDGEIKILYPNYCWGCTACLKACGFQAIELSLTSEQGSNGSTLTLVENKDYVDWKIKKSNGQERSIRTIRKQANKY